MKKLSKEQIIKIHNDLIEKTGGSKGIRDDYLLESAINTPFQTFDGNELFKTIEEKAARLGFGLTKNHAMIDGNKRIGVHSMLVFLALNGIYLSYNQDELVKLFLGIADDTFDYEYLLNWIKNHKKEN